MDDNALDLELAKSVGDFFPLTDREMEAIIDEVLAGVKQWRTVANEIGIPKSEQEIMQGAFRFR